MVTQAVLDPVAVVAGHQAGIVDVQSKTRRAHTHLRPVEEIEAPAVPTRARPLVAQLAEEAVQLRGGDPARVLRVELLDAIEQLADSSPGLGRNGDDRRP